MSTKKTNPPPEIEIIPFKDLVIDPIYSGRSEKEIKTNAKELAPMFGPGWDATQPGQYFLDEDGKKHLVVGFTRVAAAESNGLKSGYFVKREGDETSHLLACISTNGGKPVSRASRGALFASLRDGAVADDFSGAIAEKSEDWKRQPMTLEQIAEYPGVGKTSEHVRQCIAIHEAPAEVKPLLEDDQISAGVYLQASALVNKHHDGSDAKLLKVCKRAIQVANIDGKDKATPKHFDQIKAEFIPVTKLTAATPETPAAEQKPAKKAAKAEELPGAQEVEQEQAQELLPQTEVVPANVAKKQAASFRARLVALIHQWTDDEGYEIPSDKEERLADMIIDSNLPI